MRVFGADSLPSSSPARLQACVTYRRRSSSRARAVAATRSRRFTLRSCAWLSLVAWLALGCERPADGVSTPGRSAAPPATPPPPSGSSLNGCSEATAHDARDRATVVIRFGGVVGHNFDPACVRVRRGATLRFEGPLELHPIAPGRVVDGLPVDEAGPVRSLQVGEIADFVVAEVGAFGFFCDLHVVEGMMGAVYVEPETDGEKTQ